MGDGTEYYKLLITVNTRNSKEFRSPVQRANIRTKDALLSLRKFQGMEALHARSRRQNQHLQGGGLPCGASLSYDCSESSAGPRCLSVRDFPLQGPLLSWGLGPCLGQHPISNVRWWNPPSAGSPCAPPPVGCLAAFVTPLTCDFTQ